MAQTDALIYGAVILAIGVTVVLKVLCYGMRPKEYPPGPPTLPIIGNLHQMPRNGILHLRFQEWAKQYGPIVSLKLGKQTLILLNSDEAIKEVFDKNSQNTSSRMDMFLSEFGGHNQVVLRKNDEVWRRQRKMYHQNLNSTNADLYIPYQKFESILMLNDILENSEDFPRHLKRYSSSIASTMVYGWRVPSMETNEAVSKLFEWAEAQVRLGMTTAVVDWFPFLRPVLRSIPLKFSPFLREVTRLNKLESDLWLAQYKDCKARIEEGKVRPNHLTASQIMFNAGHAWAGASDTQSNTLWMFIKAMALYPEVQATAQKEIDTVLNDGRIPSYEDWFDLPYVQSCMKETFRCYPVTITGGMPHAARSEATYMGYTIPAGAGLMNNVWTINNSRGPNPRTFDPLRHVNDTLGTMESAVQADPSKRDHFTFGGGRRVCPGTHVADRGMFIAMSRLLWAFEFRPVVGYPIDRDAVTPGFIVSPIQFKCQITPRNETHAAKIRQQWEISGRSLDENGDYTEEYYRNMVRK